jgi:hypothetical protein
MATAAMGRVGSMVAPRLRALTGGLALVLLTTAAWGQVGGPASPGWFRVSWIPPQRGVVSTLKGNVFNDSPYRVTDVRLQIDGLDADHHLVGRRLAWAIGDIVPGGETSFAAEPLPGAVSYEITVVSYDLVSQVQAP